MEFLTRNSIFKKGHHIAAAFFIAMSRRRNIFFSRQLSVGSSQLTANCQLPTDNCLLFLPRKQITQRLQLIPHIARLLALGYAVDLRTALQQAIESVGGMPGKTRFVQWQPVLPDAGLLQCIIC
jgi:hypothetical protein